MRMATNVSPDQRIFEFIQFAQSLPHTINNIIYPKIYPLHNIYEEGINSTTIVIF